MGSDETDVDGDTSDHVVGRMQHVDGKESDQVDIDVDTSNQVGDRVQYVDGGQSDQAHTGMQEIDIDSFDEEYHPLYPALHG